VPGDVSLWPNLSGGEVIDLLGRLRGGFDQKRRAELLERFDLDPTKKCHTYSKGNRQKVALIAAFISDVDLYILDEPTSGLDPLMEMMFKECIAEVKKAGKTVLLSSHILAEVEQLCDHISIIKEGRIVESGSLSELRHLTRTSISVVTGQPVNGLKELSGVHDVVIDGARVQFNVDSDKMNAILQYLTRFDVQALTSTPPTLEELFMRHYELSKEAVVR
jgi:ABC-2 type transport system ATP-binding protein